MTLLSCFSSVISVKSVKLRCAYNFLGLSEKGAPLFQSEGTIPVKYAICLSVVLGDPVISCK